MSKISSNVRVVNLGMGLPARCPFRRHKHRTLKSASHCAKASILSHIVDSNGRIFGRGFDEIEFTYDFWNHLQRGDGYVRPHGWMYYTRPMSAKFRKKILQHNERQRIRCFSHYFECLSKMFIQPDIGLSHFQHFLRDVHDIQINNKKKSDYRPSNEMEFLGEFIRDDFSGYDTSQILLRMYDMLPLSNVLEIIRESHEQFWKIIMDSKQRLWNQQLDFLQEVLKAKVIIPDEYKMVTQGGRFDAVHSIRTTDEAGDPMEFLMGDVMATLFPYLYPRKWAFGGSGGMSGPFVLGRGMCVSYSLYSIRRDGTATVQRRLSKAEIGERFPKVFKTYYRVEPPGRFVEEVHAQKRLEEREDGKNIGKS